MTVLTANFATGTNGASLSTSDTGSASAWNGVLFNAGTVVYDNTHTTHSALAAKIASTTLGKQGPYWNTTGFGGSTVADMYGRFYLYATANPASGKFNTICGASTSTDFSSGIVFSLLLNSSGQILVGGAASALGTTTNSISLNQWVRIEFHIVGNSSTGSMELKLFNSPDSSTPTETVTYTAKNTGGALGAIGFGSMADSTDNTAATFWVANCVANATAYPGSFPVNSVAPAVTGSAPVGSTLTCDGGTWNGTFTLGYQWTSNGSNISGATSSTYVTQAGDAGNAIGCTVTATGQQATNESASQASGNTVTVTSGASAPSNTVAPAVTGTATVGSTLTTDNGTWSQTGTPAYTYQWQDCATSNGTFANIASATSSTYTIASGEATKYIKCVVTNTDVNGATSASSNVVGPVAAAATSGSASGGVNFPTSLLVNQSI